MTAAAGVLAILAFSAAFVAARLLPIAAQAADVAKQAMAVLGDRALNDEAKERAAQAASTRLLLAFANITLRSAAVFAAALLPIWILDRSGMVRMAEVLAFLAHPLVLLGTVAVATAVYLVRK